MTIAVPPPATKTGTASRWNSFLLTAFAVLSLAFVLPSARLWLQHPMTLTPFEFDYFLGAFRPRDLGLFLAILQAGRVIHLVGFLVIGGLFAFFVRRLLENPDAIPLPHVKVFSVVLAFVWSLGLPWVSPDVFVYIGTGWLDFHYRLSPYWHSMSEVPGFQSEGMFRNVHPPFLEAFSGYGTIFQLGARAVACASGGSEKLALVIYKIINLVIHAGCSALVLRLAPPERRSATLFFYACNPLILFSILTCAHNDHTMNLLVLAAFLMRKRGRPALAGLALAAAVSIKYVPILLVPLFAVDLLFSPGPSSKRARLLAMTSLTAPFLVGAGIMQIAYPDSVRRLFFTVTRGIGGARESLHFVLPWMRALFPNAFMPDRTSLIVLFAALYMACLLVFAWRARREGGFRLADAAVWVVLVYFLVLNETNQEWYLTWILGPLSLISTRQALTFGIRLSWLFLPLVIFTVKNSMLVYIASNTMLYFLLLGLSAPLLYHLLRGTTTDDGARKTVAQA